MRKVINSFVLVAVVIVSFFPLTLYLIKFGINPDFSLNITLANNIDDWGAFGGFIGGTIGPLISCVAFIGIWKTYNLQRLQLEQTNDQRKSEDVQRLISSTSERIDSLLNSSKEVFINFHGKRTSYHHDIHKSIAVIYDVTQKPEHDLKDHLFELIESISIELILLREDMENLSWLLEYQESIFNEKTIKEYYYFRYRLILSMMYKANLDLQPITLRVFQFGEKKDGGITPPF
ncbi:TPA: hypothetical protein ACSP23_001986 [Aeromonas hydrophila]